MSVALFSRFPATIDQFAEFCITSFGWSEIESPHQNSRIFEVAAVFGAEGTIEIWQSGSFIKATARGYVGEYLEHFFVTPDDGEDFAYCEHLHLRFSAVNKTTGSECLQKAG